MSHERSLAEEGKEYSGEIMPSGEGDSGRAGERAGVSSPRVAIDAFFKALAAQDPAAAYESTSATFHSVGSLTDFQKFLENSQVLGQAEGFNYHVREITPDRVWCEGQIKIAGGQSFPALIIVCREDGIWRIAQIDIKPNQ